MNDENQKEETQPGPHPEIPGAQSVAAGSKISVPVGWILVGDDPVPRIACGVPLEQAITMLNQLLWELQKKAIENLLGDRRVTVVAGDALAHLHQGRRG